MNKLHRSMKSLAFLPNNFLLSLESKFGCWVVWFIGFTIAISVYGILVVASPPSADPSKTNHESPIGSKGAANDSEFIQDMVRNSPSNATGRYSSAEAASAGILKTSFYYVKPPRSLISEEEENISATNLYEPTFRELHTALHHYRQMADGTVRDLSVSHEVALRTERWLFPNHHRSTAVGDSSDGITMSPSFLSKKIEEKISKVAILLERNAFVLENLLKPFPVTVGFSRFTDLDSLDTTFFSDDGNSENGGDVKRDQSKFTFPPPSTSQNTHCHTNDRDRQEVVSSEVRLARYIKPFHPSDTRIASKGNDKRNDHRDYGMESEPYETAAHVIAHMARDWTADGESIRKDTHDWIVHQLLKLFRERKNETTCSSKRSSLSPVLIPGAGMARLAFDIATVRVSNNDHADNNESESAFGFPFEVEAIDNSIVMAAAAYHLLNSSLLTETMHLDFVQDRVSVNESNEFTNNIGEQNGKKVTRNNKQEMTIFPFVSDTFVNEVDTDRRWDSASFPEATVLEKMKRIYTHQQSQRPGKDQSHSKQSMQVPTLSYTVGDFVTTFASPAKHGTYGSVATCFFIDTATNIYEYILTIRNLLRKDGVWINLGPVQWHRNAQLQPSTNELRDIIELAGFRIRHWEVSEKVIAYRHPDDVDSSHNQERGVNGSSKGARFTRSEGYRPLKFVAILKEDELAHEDIVQQSNGDLISALEKVKLLTGRRSVFMPT